MGHVQGEGQVIFSGQGFSHKGEKSRFVLPPAFRKAVTESSDGKILCLAKHERWNCLTGFGLSRKAELEAQIEREEERALRMGRDFDADLRRLQLFGFAEIPFDASGRFVMPDHLAGLGRLTVRYGPPIPLDDLAGLDMSEAARKATERLMEAIGELEASL